MWLRRSKAVSNKVSQKVGERQMFQKSTQVKFVDIISNDTITTVVLANKEDVQKFLYAFAMDRWERVFGTTDNLMSSRKAVIDRFFNQGTYTYNTGVCTVMSRAGLQKKVNACDARLKRVTKR